MDAIDRDPHVPWAKRACTVASDHDDVSVMHGYDSTRMRHAPMHETTCTMDPVLLHVVVDTLCRVLFVEDAQHVLIALLRQLNRDTRTIVDHYHQKIYGVPVSTKTPLRLRFDTLMRWCYTPQTQPPSHLSLYHSSHPFLPVLRTVFMDTIDDLSEILDPIKTPILPLDLAPQVLDQCAPVLEAFHAFEMAQQFAHHTMHGRASYGITSLCANVAACMANRQVQFPCHMDSIYYTLMFRTWMRHVVRHDCSFDSHRLFLACAPLMNKYDAVRIWIGDPTLSPSCHPPNTIFVGGKEDVTMKMASVVFSNTSSMSCVLAAIMVDVCELAHHHLLILDSNTIQSDQIDVCQTLLVADQYTHHCNHILWSSYYTNIQFPHTPLSLQCMCNQGDQNTATLGTNDTSRANHCNIQIYHNLSCLRTSDVEMRCFFASRQFEYVVRAFEHASRHMAQPYYMTTHGTAPFDAYDSSFERFDATDLMRELGRIANETIYLPSNEEFARIKAARVYASGCKMPRALLDVSQYVYKRGHISDPWTFHYVVSTDEQPCRIETVMTRFDAETVVSQYHMIGMMQVAIVHSLEIDALYQILIHWNATQSNAMMHDQSDTIPVQTQCLVHLFEQCYLNLLQNGRHYPARTFIESTAFRAMRGLQIGPHQRGDVGYNPVCALALHICNMIVLYEHCEDVAIVRSMTDAMDVEMAYQIFESTSSFMDIMVHAILPSVPRESMRQRIAYCILAIVFHAAMMAVNDHTMQHDQRRIYRHVWLYGFVATDMQQKYANRLRHQYGSSGPNNDRHSAHQKLMALEHNLNTNDDHDATPVSMQDMVLVNAFCYTILQPLVAHIKSPYYLVDGRWIREFTALLAPMMTAIHTTASQWSSYLGALDLLDEISNTIHTMVDKRCSEKKRCIGEYHLYHHLYTRAKIPIPLRRIMSIGGGRMTQTVWQRILEMGIVDYIMWTQMMLTSFDRHSQRDTHSAPHDMSSSTMVRAMERVWRLRPLPIHWIKLTSWHENPLPHFVSTSTDFTDSSVLWMHMLGHGTRLYLKSCHDEIIQQCAQESRAFVDTHDITRTHWSQFESCAYFGILQFIALSLSTACATFKPTALAPMQDVDWMERHMDQWDAWEFHTTTATFDNVRLDILTRWIHIDTVAGENAEHAGLADILYATLKRYAFFADLPSSATQPSCTPMMYWFTWAILHFLVFIMQEYTRDTLPLSFVPVMTCACKLDRTANRAAHRRRTMPSPAYNTMTMLKTQILNLVETLQELFVMPCK